MSMHSCTCYLVPYRCWQAEACCQQRRQMALYVQVLQHTWLAQDLPHNMITWQTERVREGHAYLNAAGTQEQRTAMQSRVEAMATVHNAQALPPPRPPMMPASVPGPGFVQPHAHMAPTFTHSLQPRPPLHTPFRNVPSESGHDFAQRLPVVPPVGGPGSIVGFQAASARQGLHGAGVARPSSLPDMQAAQLARHFASLRQPSHQDILRHDLRESAAWSAHLGAAPPQQAPASAQPQEAAPEQWQWYAQPATQQHEEQQGSQPRPLQLQQQASGLQSVPWPAPMQPHEQQGQQQPERQP